MQSDWKAVIINAVVVGPSGLTFKQRENFSVEVSLDGRIAKFDGGYIHERIPVTIENFGDWHFSVQNYNKDVELIVRWEVYKIR